MNTRVFIVILVLVLFFLSACAPGSLRFEDEGNKAGFFWGIWHGWIAPVSLIWQIFNPNVRIYEANNAGWLYDFGYYIAIIGGFGGLALSRKKHKDK